MTDEHETTAVPMRDRYADILRIQRQEALANQGDPYMVGLYNGMLMMCCNEDNVEYYPLDVVTATKRTRAPALPWLSVTEAGVVSAPCAPRLVDEDTGHTD